jgi:hypothetical protein
LVSSGANPNATMVLSTPNSSYPLRPIEIANLYHRSDISCLLRDHDSLDTLNVLCGIDSIGQLIASKVRDFKIFYSRLEEE